MKIPKEIKIIGFNWQVVTGKASDEVAYEGNCYGSTHPKTQKIFLDRDTTNQNREKTFIHEILHALWWQMGIGKRKEIDNKLEEEIIHPLSQGLYRVLKDNKFLR